MDDAATSPVIAGRTAIVHDWFQGFHGAERVVETMRAELFPPGNGPDIFTFHAARELLPRALSDAIVGESRVARLPGIRQRGHDPGLWRYLLPYMPWYFGHLPLDDYDLVISSSHACALHARPSATAVHAVYCYTPMRYAWLPQTERGRVTGPFAAALGAYRGRLRAADRIAAQRPDGFAAISTAVRERIRSFYGRDAVVIHPPVDIDDLDGHREREPDRFLWVHRLVSYKRPELVAEAFRDLPYRLTMVGVGPLEARLRRRLPPNVELRGWVDRSELAELYARAAGFIHLGEEDFGITMVEALAAGTPVIALNRGGARDVLGNADSCGLLLPRADVRLLRSAVAEVSRRSWDRSTLAARAGAFSRERFTQQMRRWLGELTASRRAGAV